MPSEQAGNYDNSALQAGRYRPEIDGLRAFAVIAVIINHFNNEILPGGYLGVDIFFVISGYVITSSLFERPSKDFKDFISGFYERRIKRLAPALSVFVLIASIAICLVNPEPGVQLGLGKRALFGFSNIALYSQSLDYFAQEAELNIFTHTWSLGVEEQFYILFPFLVWFSGFGRITKNGARNLFLIVVTLSLASIFGFLYLYRINQPAAYFLMPFRFWEMATGCLIFIGFQKRLSIGPTLEKVPPLLVLGLIVCVMYLPISLSRASTILVIALSSFVIGSLNKQSAAFKVLTNPKIVYIGLISYSLYLWHWGVLTVSRWTIGIHWWSVPFQVALMLCLAVVSYRWIETPLRKNKWFGTRWKTILTGGGVLFALSCCLSVLANPLKGKLYTSRYKHENLITAARNLENKENEYNGRNCHFADRELDKGLPLSNCALGASKQQKTFYFAGNSHANHYRELHYLLNKEHGAGVFSVTISTCIFPHHAQKRCKKAQRAIESYVVSNIRRGDVVVVSNRYISNRDKSDQEFFDYSWMKTRTSIELINRLGQKIASKGGILVLFSPTPEYDVGIEECKPSWFRPFRKKECHKSLIQAKHEASSARSLLSEFLDRQIYIYDPIDAICRGNECSMIDSDYRPLYIDAHHLTDFAAAKYVYPDFVSYLGRMGLLAKVK